MFHAAISKMFFTLLISTSYSPLHDSQALPPMGGSPLLFPFTTPLLLFITAGFGLLLGKK